jgi:hypothetical protein
MLYFYVNPNAVTVSFVVTNANFYQEYSARSRRLLVSNDMNVWARDLSVCHLGRDLGAAQDFNNPSL